MSSNPPPATSGAASGGSSGRGGGGGGGRGGGGNSRRKNRANKGKKPNDDANKKSNAGKSGQATSASASATTANPGASNSNAAAEKKKRNNRRRKKNNDNKKPGQEGGGGGGGNNNNNSKNKSKPSKQEKQQQKPKPKPKPKPKEPTEEELHILAEQKAEAERQAAIKKAAEDRAKAIAKREGEIQALEATFREKVSHLTAFIDKTLQRRKLRADLAPEELSKKQASFQSSKSKLKSDLKKCTAFCKKIKSTNSFDDNVVKSFLKDADTLNLTRYLEEIANAFLESKLKVADVQGVAKVCIALHERYRDFMVDIFLPSLLRSLKGKTAGEVTDAKQKRIFLRILTELLICGVLPETKPVMKIVADAAGAPKGDGTVVGEKYVVNDPNMLVSFAKAAGHELIGVIPKSILEDVEFILEEEKRLINAKANNEKVQSTPCTKDEDAEQKESDGGEEKNVQNPPDELDMPVVVSPAIVADAKDSIQRLEMVRNDRAVSDEVCDRFKKHLTGAFQYLCVTLVATHKKLVKMEKRCEQDRLLAGSISEERERALTDARKLLESLRKSVEALSEVLNDTMPELVAEEDEKKADVQTGLELYKGEDGRDSNLGPFDDEETRAFYCDIPDLLTTIPPTLLGYSPEDVEKIQEANSKKYGDNSDEDGDKDELSAVDENEAQEKDFEEADEENYANKDAGKNKTEEGNAENKDAPHYKLMLLIEEELPECNRRDKIDELAEKFCTNHGATKNARKRLEKALFLVPRSRLDLIPYYSRLAAIFDRVFPEISTQLVKELEQQFHGLSRWKKQQSIENRIRNARFIGELTKFRVSPPIVALRCLRRCIQDFSGYNIDIACCLLESCGRYLHRTRHTTAKLANIMETMERIRKAKHFDERAVELMKSAFYMVQPPETKVRRKVKVLSPTEAYLKELLLVRLDKSNVSFVSKQLLRFPWGDPSVDYGELVVKYMLKACRKGRYNSISAVSSLVSNMKKPKPELLARLIDGLLEALHYVMEHPNIRDQQRAIVYTKLLGEMHANALVSSQAIFDQLYNFVNFDHAISKDLREASNKSRSELDTMSSVLKSPLGVSGAIAEDEEMDEDDDEMEDSEKKEEDANQPPAPVAVSMYSDYDPRVPSFLDPPNAVFRIKLICTLLDNCVSSLVTTANFSKLEKFLAAFQRYLFIKDTLPTDIEFSLLDTFDLIESNLKVVRKDGKRNASIVRHKTWADAHNAVIAAEEFEASIQQKARNRLLAQAGIVTASPDDDGLDETIDDQDSLDDGSVDDISVNSLDDESVDNSEGASDDEIMSEDEDDESGDESVEDDDEMQDEEDEAAAHEAYIRKLEDEAFERELRKLTMEALEKGKHSARTLTSAKVSASMPSASQFARSKKIASDSMPTNESDSNGIFALSGANGMNFQLIKRGHKGRAETKSLIVPSDTNLAKIATKQDNEAARERDMLKERVLRYEAESAEQAYSGDVYMDQGHLPEVRNRTLRMVDIDRQFGKSRSSYGGRGPYRGRGHSGGRGLKRF